MTKGCDEMYFKNHFGMVVSTVVALFLTFWMAIIAMFLFGLDKNLTTWYRTWSVVFLTIMLCTFIFPSKLWGDKFALKCGLRANTLPFGLVSNIVPTLIYNTAAQIALPAVNIFHNPNIPEAAQWAVWWEAATSSWPTMFLISYVVAMIGEAIAVKVAFKCAPPAVELQKDER